MKSRVAFVDIMLMGQCRSLVLERFPAAVTKEAIEKMPLQLLSRNLAQRSHGTGYKTSIYAFGYTGVLGR